MTSHRIAIAALVATTGPLACITKRLPDHCGNNLGDRSCEAGQFCNECIGDNNGCVDERPVEGCHYPGPAEDDGESSSSGGSGSSGDATTTDSGTSGTSSDSGTTGPDTCDGPEDCLPSAPFCDPAGQCVTCDGVDAGACAQLDPTMPVCAAGECVQCSAAETAACGGTTPLCEGNTCVGCNAHEQCGQAACNMFTGACLPADAVVHVGPGEEFTTLTAAVGSLEGGDGTVIVHDDNYNEALTISEGTVALLASDDSVPSWDTSGAGDGPQLTVSGTVLLDGLELSGNGDNVGVHTDGGQVWIDRSRVVDNNGGGITADGGAELVVRNCFVGGSLNNAAAVGVSGSTANVLASTIASGFGAATSLMCDGDAAVTVRNSILVAETNEPEVACSGATIDYSAAEADLGGTNTAVGAVDLGWFVNYGSANLHLSASGATTFADLAQWQDGDPIIDIDGDLRPSTDGAMDYPGADVP